MRRSVLLLLVVLGCTRPHGAPTASSSAPVTAHRPATSSSTSPSVWTIPTIPPGWTPPAKAKVTYPPGVVVIKPGAVPHPPPDGVDVVHEVVVDEKDAFFSDGFGYVWRAPKDGSGAASMVWDAKNGHAMSLVLHGGDVLFALTPPWSPNGKSKPMIVRVPKTGGAHVTLSVETEDPLYLVRDDTNLYFALFDGTSVRRIPLAGGASVAVRTPGIKSGSLAVDPSGGSLYVSDYARGTVSKISKATNAETVLASGMPKPVGIAIDATHVYFPCEGDGSVRRVAKSGGPLQVLATQQINNDELVVDDTWVWWSTWAKPHALMRTKKDGSGTAVTVVPNLHEPTGLSLDTTPGATSVYVANKGAGEVLVVPR